MTKEWLRTGMFASENKPGRKINKILKELGDHALTKSHARHLSIERCRDMGLNVSEIESCDELQEAVLSLHHACMLTFSATPAFKIIENHRGVAFIKIAQQVVVAGPPIAGQEMEEAPNKAMQRSGFAGR